jgi:phage/plasmid-associated DNA primase
MNFDAPEIIQKETENYFYELDSVSQYIDPSSEHVIITNNDKDKIQQSDLFEDYVNFCKQNNLTFTKKSNFYSTLSKKFTKKKVRGYIHFCGLKWPDDDDEDDCEKLL